MTLLYMMVIVYGTGEDVTIEKEITHKNGATVSLTSINNNGNANTIKVTYVELPVQNFFVNGTSNTRFKRCNDKTSYSFKLVENTVECYNEFTTSREKTEIKSNQDQFRLHDLHQV